MIKFLADCKDGKMIGIGLSKGNIGWLTQDRPIYFDGNEIGLPGVNVFIFYGETEQKMEVMLKDYFKEMKANQ